MTKQMTQEREKKPWFMLSLLPFLKPYRGILISMILLSQVGVVMDVASPVFLRFALGHFVVKESIEGLGLFALAYALLILVGTGANAISAYQGCQIEMYVGRDMKQASFDKLQNLSLSYFNQNSVGYIHARVMSDTDRIGAWVAWGCLELVWNTGYLLGIMGVMLYFHLRLALLVLLFVPVGAAISAYFQRRMIILGREVRESNSRITGLFNEGITGIEAVKTLGLEEKMLSSFEGETSHMKRVSLLLGRSRALMLSLVSFLASMALALVLWRGGLLTREGLMELGTLSVFMTYVLGMMEPVRGILSVLANLVNVRVNLERFSKLMQTRTEVEDSKEVEERYGDSFSPKKENWEPLVGDVEFRDVSFHYPDGEEMIFSHFSLKVPQGTNLAIVGETGAGKSTLVNLLCRFYEPTGGQVLIDGRDVKERSILWLHSHLGYVIQSPLLFSGSIADNLRYGKPEATEEEMWEALRAVSAQDIPLRMGEGLSSKVGEGGHALSTGEKQLLSFARALLADPRIFVLDEATSSIDTVTEKKIQDATALLLKGRTSFIIAHHLSTIRQADMILMVEAGEVVERGTHGELMRMRGKYYEMYRRQSTLEREESL